MGEHRVPVLAGSRRYPDPARSSDPRIRNLVTALGTLPAAPPPRAHFRAELRSQLVSVTPRLVTEDAHDPADARPARRIARVPVGRTVRIATATLAVIVMVLSGAVWLSRSALPGDPLYGVKRAGEDVQLAFATSKQARAHDLLSFAGTRAGEVSALLSHAGAIGSGPQADASLSRHTAALVTRTLGSADGDLRQASTLLGDVAVTQHSAVPLQAILAWVPGQRAKLAGIAARIPAGPLHTRVLKSETLVTRAGRRAEQLSAEAACTCLSSGRSDSLGPVPCTGGCMDSTVHTGDGTAQPSPGATPGRPPGPGPAGRSSGSTGNAGPGAGGGHHTSGAKGGAPTPGGARPSVTPTPGSSAPSLPGTLPSIGSLLPTGSGGLSLCPSISLGPIHIAPSGCVVIGG